MDQTYTVTVGVASSFTRSSSASADTVSGNSIAVGTPSGVKIDNFMFPPITQPTLNKLSTSDKVQLTARQNFDHKTSTYFKLS
jgi:hypothetical protein